MTGGGLVVEEEGDGCSSLLEGVGGGGSDEVRLQLEDLESRADVGRWR